MHRAPTCSDHAQHAMFLGAHANMQCAYIPCIPCGAMLYMQSARVTCSMPCILKQCHAFSQKNAKDVPCVSHAPCAASCGSPCDVFDITCTHAACKKRTCTGEIMQQSHAGRDAHLYINHAYVLVLPWDAKQETLTRVDFYQWLSKISANGTRRYIRNVFSHWLKPYLAMHRKRTWS